MKCLVFSDSHGSTVYMQKAIGLHPDADIIFFLGDGISDAALLAEYDRSHTWICVRGNCDFSSFFLGQSLSKTEEITVEGKKIVATHGDMYSVKYGYENIKSLAKSRKADIVLFGHTHIPHEEYTDEGVYLFNPGSISSPSFSFGILTVKEGSVLFSHGKF